MIVFVFLLGCSKKEWVHTLQGSSEHWEASMDIKPVDDPDVEAVFVGKIKLKTPVTLKSAQYEAQVRNGSPGGDLRHDLEKLQNFETVQIFSTYAHSATKPTFHQNMPEKELASMFSDLTFQMTWEDENGQHVEEILLDTIIMGK
ncbi:hypothetical protein NDK47_01150 [Brevibacillus ruminantium]|uniref:Lipoprotein n=1 Tax=Brevibacillus ruminantium TaxID=2950604 RepID=A0ABY4WGK3_9BACL|nr:hypothetical protein [Brevibacillus ruminantium]USG65994.1 hypothetical protein NDK47_01150 [Brevibacillus ruminantium]